MTPPLQALRALGTGNEPSAAVKQRIHARIVADVLTAAALGVGAATPSVLGAATPKAALRVGARLGLQGFRGIAVASTLTLASGVGSVLAYRALHPVETRIVYVRQAPTTTTSATVPPPPLAETSVLMRAEAPLPPTSEKPAALPTASSAKRDDTGRSSLARERSLLDRARTELGHDAQAALRLASEHEQSFPAGALREEREALAIRALINLGRYDEARARLLAFRAAFPQSFLAPALSAAMAAP
jgi:hypothetical protein